MKLKVAIIGCGGIANGKHLPSLHKLEQVEIVALCDIVESRAQEACARYGVPGAKVYTDYKELLKDESIQVVNVFTPNDAHAAVSIAALDAGKHVMCEKPIAKTAAEAREMIAAANRSGKKLTVGYNNRFRNDSMYLQQACRRGVLGDIYFAKAHAIRRRGVPTWGVFLDEEKQGGGPLIDIGTHALDLTLWMMDNYEPQSVMGTTFHKLSSMENAANPFGPWDPKQFTVEDSAFGMIRMKNGATVILESSWALNTMEVDEAKCTLCGTKAGADMRNGLTFNGESAGNLYIQNIDMQTGGVAFYEGRSESPSDLEARLWIESILDDKDPVVKQHEALIVSEILEAIYVSAKTQKAVYFD